MDWQLAITRNREALTAIIMALIKSLGLSEGVALTTLPIAIYTRALAIIRPAESAVRRLIIIAAMQLSPSQFRLRTPRARQTDFALLRQRAASPIPAFTLIDPLKTFGDQSPDFQIIDPSFDEDHEPKTTTRLSAITLGRRLLALKKALDTIPREAKRLARWYAVRDAALQASAPHRLSPLRPGPPIGLPRRKRTEVQNVLLECHLLAIYARDQHDSS
jgi:hypothetical protein